MYLCVCRGITVEKFREEVKKFNSLLEMQNKLRFSYGSGACGSCMPKAVQLFHAVQVRSRSNPGASRSMEPGSVRSRSAQQQPVSDQFDTPRTA